MCGTQGDFKGTAQPGRLGDRGGWGQWEGQGLRLAKKESGSAPFGGRDGRAEGAHAPLQGETPPVPYRPSSFFNHPPCSILPAARAAAFSSRQRQR